MLQLARKDMSLQRSVALHVMEDMLVMQAGSAPASVR